MAKGFTVKTVAPKPKEQDWDIDAIKERMRESQLYFVFLVVGVLLFFSRHLYNSVLILYKQAQVFKSLKIIHQWSTLPVASVLVQMY